MWALEKVNRVMQLIEKSYKTSKRALSFLILQTYLCDSGFKTES